MLRCHVPFPPRVMSYTEPPAVTYFSGLKEHKMTILNTMNTVEEKKTAFSTHPPPTVYLPLEIGGSLLMLRADLFQVFSLRPFVLSI